MRRIGDKTYVPFDLGSPLHKDYLRQKAWIRNYLGEERLITGIFGGSTVYALTNISPEILLRDWTFLDGSPCGVEKASSEEHI